ncbi:MAG TPA: DinB family protein [Pyrinomonadaceae bacterium]|nr:DinB family protein [Pyrinomonadaceae bacterium]
MRPQPNEATAYYHSYIDRVTEDDVVSVLERQLDETVEFLSNISEEQSLKRYASDKWSMRELLNHVNDGERVFLYRALWFARGFKEELPSFDQEVSVAGARADEFDWANHIEEFRANRLSTLAFFRNLPAENLEEGQEVWNRKGIASGNTFTVRALAYIIAGHLAHHVAILKERYL